MNIVVLARHLAALAGERLGDLVRPKLPPKALAPRRSVTRDHLYYLPQVITDLQNKHFSDPKMVYQLTG